MTDYFSQCLKFTMGPQIEGGFVDHPLDRGGRTNFGITQRTYDAWRKKQAFIYPEDVKDINRDIAGEIYRSDFWVPSGSAKLAWPLCLCHFDAFVNHRPSVARSFLSKCNGRWEAYLALRKAFFERLIAKDPSQEVFRKGWMNRLKHVKTECLRKAKEGSLE